MEITALLDTFLSQYISDPKWYPYILILIWIFFLLIIYIIFMYIRSFVSWIFGVNEVIALQKEQNHLLRELIVIQEEQRELLESLFVEEKHEEYNPNTPFDEDDIPEDDIPEDDIPEDDIPEDNNDEIMDEDTHKDNKERKSPKTTK